MLNEIEMELAARRTLESLAMTTARQIRQPVASLSGGQRQSVAVAKAVMANSKLVILDEPTAALGVTQTAMVLSLVKKLTSQGVTVLMISHNLNDIFQVADHLAIVHLGHLVASGPASNFNRQTAVDYMTTGRSNREAAGSPALAAS
jgi:ABC-type sugar transport system ATPase subunit